MAGQLISHYRVVRKLGAGGMGEVLLARDTKLERAVAIKLMSAELAKDPGQRKRFQAEAKAASALSHPNICVIHEVGESADERPFLAMEYIEGQTLEGILTQRRVKIREAISIGAQVADALEAAHAAGIVHRDIKPGNIMLDNRGRAKVLDFGLAKKFGLTEPASKSTTATSDTATGFLVGTPHYMSPEQALGADLDQRSDIFSLGVVLYELVAGQRPFLGKTVGETINQIINTEPRPLGLVNPLYAPALDGIIFKCLAKKPENRYASARQLADDLAQLRAATEQASSTKTAVASDPSSETGTKLWQLADKTVRPASSPVALVIGLAVICMAALILGHFVPSPGARLTIAILAVALGIVLAYRWFQGRDRGVLRRQRRGDSASPQPATGPVSSPVSSDEKRSLAVLPFANFSAEKDTDYLSDGLSEEITTALGRLPGLKVAARNSAFAFKGRNEDARKIGETLRVAMLLEGSVRKSGRQIRVTAQLINAADGYQIWSETLDRDLNDVIAVQDEIARRIAERLRVEIGIETSAAMAQRRPVNPEAHVIYLQGRHAWNQRTRADLERAVQLFRNAIDLDPTYAAAHAGLAAAYVVLPGYAYRPASEYLPLACVAARRALELDPTSAEAHAVLGDAGSQSGDFDTAIPHLKRAIELNPNYATGHQWYGEALKEMNRMDEAMAEFRTAEELDPLSPRICACLPECYYLLDRTDEVIAEAKKALAIFPNFPTLQKFHALALMRQGRYREALTEVIGARSQTPDAPARLDLLVFCQARLGHETEARAALAELENWRSRGYDVDEELGLAHVGLRQYDQAVEALERFAVSGIYRGSTLRNPLLKDELGGHPRFQAVLKKAGLAS